MGVCAISDICSPELTGTAREYYVLIPAHIPNAKIYAPTEGNPVCMRGLISKRGAEEFVAALPRVRPIEPSQTRQEQHRTYCDVLKSADNLQLAQLLKALYIRKQKLIASNKLGSLTEKDYTEKAEMILFGELAAALGIEIGEVEAYITDAIGHAAII